MSTETDIIRRAKTQTFGRDPKKLLVEIGLSNTFNSQQKLAIYFDEAILKYIVLKVFRAVRRSLKLISMNVVLLKLEILILSRYKIGYWIF